jgi:hypothetical protein
MSATASVPLLGFVDLSNVVSFAAGPTIAG